MSFDMIFWYEREPSTPEQAAQIHDKLTDEEVGIVERSSVLSDFYQEVIATYRDLTENTPEEDAEVAPWTTGVYHNEECVITPISWWRCKEVGPALIAMAARHGVTTYNPQDRIIYYPSGQSAQGMRTD
jgi:hypothetical protein